MPESAKRPTVMVVDDSTTIQQAAKSFLEPDWQVKAAGNGLDAIAAISHVRPDLVLLDIMMPVLRGDEVIQVLRSLPEFAALPIIVLSSRDSPFDRARLSLLGCDAYLTKPFERDALRQAVAKALGDAGP